ncbi:MAG: nickel-type superoxide dismutase maturation protease [Leptolyngbya sp.]|nr:nickel-type superoxide dismutase maturation protease [Leptolyngbya sp.]
MDITSSDLPHATGWEVALWLLRRRRRFRVSGESMLPLLQPGEEVLVNPAAYRQVPPAAGDIVVATHPQQPTLPIIKRVLFVAGDRCYLRGDNPAVSTDSRRFGLVPHHAILGRVVCRFP